MSERAVFLDRDGTIIEEVGYLYHPDQVSLLPKAPESLALLRRAGFKLVMVSNQSGVARGYFNIEDVKAANDRLAQMLYSHQIELDAAYFCPHLEGCSCRKPSPGMVHRAVEELGIDPELSYVVGDRVSDLELATNVGATSILVLSGYGATAQEELEETGMAPTHVAADLYEAGLWILRREGLSRY